MKKQVVFIRNNATFLYITHVLYAISLWRAIMQNNEMINNKYAIVAGNAPSLAGIDYKRLPLKYDVFRCNQFYFEDKYYLGKNIKAVTFATQMLAEQIYTTLHLNSNNEYNIESVFIVQHHVLPTTPRELELERLVQIFHHNVFIQTLYEGKYSCNIEAFLEYIKLQKLYYYKNPTSAIFLCAIAISMGYKEIYLTGIDFYESGTYAFNVLQENILHLMPHFRMDIDSKQFGNKNEFSYHSKEADLEALTFLSRHYGIKFYSLCPNSPLTQYFPLAPITNNTFMPTEKPSNYTKDILIPQGKGVKYMQDTLRFNLHLHDKKLQKRNRIKNNFYFKIFDDLMRLPRDMKHYFKNLKKG